MEAKARVRSGDLRPMAAFVGESTPRRAIVVTDEDDRRRIGGIDVMPFTEFLDLLHGGTLLES